MLSIPVVLGRGRRRQVFARNGADGHFRSSSPPKRFRQKMPRGVDVILGL